MSYFGGPLLARNATAISIRKTSVARAANLHWTTFFFLLRQGRGGRVGRKAKSGVKSQESGILLGVAASSKEGRKKQRTNQYRRRQIGGAFDRTLPESHIL